MKFRTLGLTKRQKFDITPLSDDVGREGVILFPPNSNFTSQLYYIQLHLKTSKEFILFRCQRMCITLCLTVFNSLKSVKKARI